MVSYTNLFLTDLTVVLYISTIHNLKGKIIPFLISFFFQFLAHLVVVGCLSAEECSDYRLSLIYEVYIVSL